MSNPPEAQNADAISNDELLNRIRELEAAQEQTGKDRQRIQDLEAALAAANAGRETVSVPEHAGGPGTEIAETWSQYDQDLARKGLHSGLLVTSPPQQEAAQ